MENEKATPVGLARDAEVHALAMALGFPLGSIWDTRTSTLRWEGQDLRGYNSIYKAAQARGLAVACSDSGAGLYRYRVEVTVP